MKRIIFSFVLMIISGAVGAQGVKVAFAGNRPQDTAYAARSLRIDSALRLLRYAGADTNKVLAVDAYGNVGLKSIAFAAGVTQLALNDSTQALRQTISASSPDSSIFQTKYRSDTERKNIYPFISTKQDALGFTAENVANKATSFGVINNTLYTSVQAVNTQINASVAPKFNTADSTYLFRKVDSNSHGHAVTYDYFTNNLPSLTGYVPYSGATSTLALGNQFLTMTGSSELHIHSSQNAPFSVGTVFNVNDVGSVTTGAISVTDGNNIAIGTTTGTKIGSSTSQKLGFWNKTPITQPSGDVATALSNMGLISSPTIPAVTSITAGTGLSGGTITGAGTISMPNTGTAGTYGDATHIPAITTDAQGRVSGVTTYTITPSATYTAGTGIAITTANVVSANLSTGVSGGQTAIGGTGATDVLTFKSTTGNQTSGNAYTWLGGNNGATTLQYMRYNGDVTMGASYNNGFKLQLFGSLKIGGDAGQQTGSIALGDDNTNAMYNGMFRGTSTGGLGGGNYCNVEGYDGLNLIVGHASGFGANTPSVQVLTGGVVMINTTSNDGVNKLQVNGGATFAGGLTVTSTTQGLLPPRMTTTQKNAISSPAEGLMLYDLTLHQMSYYNGSTWINY